jgi:hypothetical protein
MGGEGKKLVTVSNIFAESHTECWWSAIIFCLTTEVTVQPDHLYIDVHFATAT